MLWQTRNYGKYSCRKGIFVYTKGNGKEFKNIFDDIPLQIKADVLQKN